MEVVFSDSAKGALKMAKSYGKNNVIGGAIGYIGKKPSKEELKKHFEGNAIEGSFNDVVCIGLNLDIGDISGEIDSDERKSEFVKVLGTGNFEDSEKFFKTQREDIDKLIDAAKEGEPIRVWNSHTPFSACAFAFVCYVLKNIDCHLSVVMLPQYWGKTEKTILSYSDWAQIDPAWFYLFLPLERRVSTVEKHSQSCLWNDLRTENAALRALVNGILISVPEDFYDHIIIKSIPNKEFVMAQLIGTILRNYPLGVADGWYALRINKMIAENRLKIVEDKDASYPYGRILRTTI